MQAHGPNRTEMRGPWQGLALIAVSSVGFGLGGGLVGILLGLLAPGYYRTVFGGEGVVVDPVPTGFGLGVTQGMLAGLFVGAFLVVWFTVRPEK